MELIDNSIHLKINNVVALPKHEHEPHVLIRSSSLNLGQSDVAISQIDILVLNKDNASSKLVSF